MTNHYETLQVTRTASDEAIRGAYRYLCQKWHPDKHPGNTRQAEQITQQLNEAYRVLSDPQLRAQHDVELGRNAPDQPAQQSQASSSSDPAHMVSGFFRRTWFMALFALSALTVANILLTSVTELGRGGVVYVLLRGTATLFMALFFVALSLYSYTKLFPLNRKAPAWFTEVALQLAHTPWRDWAKSTVGMLLFCGLLVTGSEKFVKEGVTTTTPAPSLPETVANAGATRTPTDPAARTVELINECAYPLDVALLVRDVGGNGWKASGWYGVAAHSRSTVSPGAIDNVVYFYPKSQEGEWSSDTDDTGIRAAVTDEAFSYRFPDETPAGKSALVLFFRSVFTATHSAFEQHFVCGAVKKASSESDLPTRFGALSWDEAGLLRYQGTAIVPQVVRDPYALQTPVARFELESRDVLLLQQGEGNSCPGKFRFVTVSSAGASATAAFGTCADDLPSPTLSGQTISFRSPASGAAAEKEFVYQDGTVFIDGRPAE